MISIKILKSYRLQEKAIAGYNKGKKSTDQLKPAHFEVLKLATRLLSKEVSNVQAAGGNGYRGDLLHNLRTNSKQLFKMSGRKVRTIYNLLKRLISAGFIGKIFHGSNASYEIIFNPQLLHIEDDTLPHPFNVSDRFDLRGLPCLRQILPHTLPRVPRDTSKLNELSGLPSDASDTSSADAVTPKRQDTNPGYHPGNATPQPAASTATQGTLSPKSSAKKVLARELPDSMEEMTACLSDRDRAWLPTYVNGLYDYALSELDQFFPGWIAASVHRKAKIALAEYFVHTNPKLWKAAALEFTERIDLVTGTMERKYQAGKRASLPIPSYYFDIRNKLGFVGTKAWHKRSKQEINRAKVNSTIGRSVKQYLRAVQSNKTDTADVLLKIKQHLEKRGGPKLYSLFLKRLNTVADLNGKVA